MGNCKLFIARIQREEEESRFNHDGSTETAKKTRANEFWSKKCKAVPPTARGHIDTQAAQDTNTRSFITLGCERVLVTWTARCLIWSRWLLPKRFGTHSIIPFVQPWFESLSSLPLSGDLLNIVVRDFCQVTDFGLNDGGDKATDLSSSFFCFSYNMPVQTDRTRKMTG